MPKLLESYVPKQIQALGHGIKLPATIPANAGDVAAGQVMGVRTADSGLMPVRRALITANALDSAKTATVGAANAIKFNVGDTVAWRTLTDETAHDMGAVTAVDAAAGTVTFTNATGAAITANQAYLYVADGTEVAKAIMEYSVLDDTEAQQVSPFVVGVFYESELTGFDAVAMADLGARRLLNGLVKV